MRTSYYGEEGGYYHDGDIIVDDSTTAGFIVPSGTSSAIASLLQFVICDY